MATTTDVTIMAIDKLCDIGALPDSTTVGELKNAIARSSSLQLHHFDITGATNTVESLDTKIKGLTSLSVQIKPDVVSLFITLPRHRNKAGQKQKARRILHMRLTRYECMVTVMKYLREFFFIKSNVSQFDSTRPAITPVVEETFKRMEEQEYALYLGDFKVLPYNTCLMLNTGSVAVLELHHVVKDTELELREDSLATIFPPVPMTGERLYFYYAHYINHSEKPVARVYQARTKYEWNAITADVATFNNVANSRDMQFNTLATTLNSQEVFLAPVLVKAPALALVPVPVKAPALAKS